MTCAFCVSGRFFGMSTTAQHFLLRLHTLAQQLPTQQLISKGFVASDNQVVEFQRTMASWELWLEPDCLNGFCAEDYSEIDQSILKAVPNMISEFNSIALQRETATREHKDKAATLLCSLWDTFACCYEAKYGKPASL